MPDEKAKTKQQGLFEDQEDVEDAQEGKPSESPRKATSDDVAYSPHVWIDIEDRDRPDYVKVEQNNGKVSVLIEKKVEGELDLGELRKDIDIQTIHIARIIKMKEKES